LPDNRDSLQNEILSLKAALFDGITRLPCYTSRFEQLKHITQNRFMGIIFLQLSDLDRLEAVFGFQRYEEILARFSQLTQDHNNRAYDGALVVTQRGVFNDQFCVFVPYDILAQAPLEALEKIAKGIYKVLDNELLIQGIQGIALHLGYSVLHYNPFLRFERSVHRAVEEAADVAESQEEAERLLHELELRQIISRRSFQTLYHPIVNMEEMEAVGYEALTRGPMGTLYESPEALFAYAKQTKLGRELDRQCKFMAIQSARNKPKGTRLFINTLPTTLDDPEFLQGSALKHLKESGMTPEDVVWELTERHAIEDFDSFGKLMAEYTDLGYNVAIDDVGTGYSSIQTITHVRPSYLKIDRSLVMGIEENLLKQELVSSLISLGANIHATVIAEGIETVREMKSLREMGVTFGQGFLFGYPASDFPRKVSTIR